ncbi:MAG: 4-(cytidine 5'-diphospho)-2-C-methyl-D-erythritol kinase [Actinomycetota bacterium]|nr:4-(cytidine 5'-diphospho)-2-C-methyl-D-erythritol kinase [Actinomycetota bacterium]
MSAAQISAYAKVNLCLFLGQRREDGRHDLVTLLETVELADQLEVTPSGSGSDQVICPGVPGPNLVSAALTGLRSAGWDAPAVRVEIDKRIPVAAGMGGGSADAAAILRHAPSLAAVAPEVVFALAASLGSDVPSQLDPGPSVGTGAGDLLRPLPDPAQHGLLVLPQPVGLSTADVYRAADGLDRARNPTELLAVDVALEVEAAHPGWTLPPSLVVNELQAAALTLRPEIARALAAARGAGAERAIVCGSGPTVIGVFWGPDGLVRATVAAEALAGQFPGALATRPRLRGVGRAVANP